MIYLVFTFSFLKERGLKYDFDKVVNRAGTDCVKWDHYEMKEEINDMIPMSIADMDFMVPDFITEALMKRARHGIFGYTIVPDSYYSSLVDWLERRFGWSVKRDWIRFSPGVVPALNFAVQAFTEPGDKVIIQPPVYHPFRYSVTNNGRTVLNNPLICEGGAYRMDIDGLKRSIEGRTKMLILSNPHNPVGRVWKREELLALAEVCLENRIIIISDEIHSDILMPGFMHIPMASLSEEIAKITVTCTSPSKTFNLAELQVANIIITDYGLYSLFDLALAKVNINRPNVMGLAASEAAYKNGDEWVEELNSYINGNYLFMRGFFKENLPQVKTATMEGTYLGWLDFRGLGSTHKEMEKKLLTKARVAMTPGNIFGSEGEGFFRMNLACPRTTLEEALRRIEKAMKEA